MLFFGLMFGERRAIPPKIARKREAKKGKMSEHRLNTHEHTIVKIEKNSPYSQNNSTGTTGIAATIGTIDTKRKKIEPLNIGKVYDVIIGIADTTGTAGMIVKERRLAKRGDCLQMVGIPMKRIGLPLFIAFLAATCPVFGQPIDFPELTGKGSVAQTLRVQSTNVTGAPILQVQKIQLSSETRGNVIRWFPPPVEEASQDQSEPALPRTIASAQPPHVAASARNSGNALPLPLVNRDVESSKLLLASAPSPEFDSEQRNNVTFASPVVAGDRSNISFNPAGTSPALTPSAPKMNTLPVFQPQHGAPNGVVANNVPVPVPAVMARPVAQNAVTQSHPLRLPAQVFEKNLIEKLGSRFVPVRNVAEASGISQYRLPVRDGTDIELVINRQQGTVSVTGSPGMVDASLRIVRLLDIEEVAGGPVARFVPVQQSNVDAARRVADIVNRETMRVAQVDRPAAAGPLPLGLGEDELTAAGIVGPVNIEIIDQFGTMIIRGSPEDVEIIRGMLRELETLSLENEPIIELVPLWHADSLRVSQLVLNLYQQVYQVRRGVIIMQPLVKPNTILIIGRQESINAAKELIAKLDTPVIPNAAFRIFHLRHAAATETANTIITSFANRQGAGQGLSMQLNAGQVIADFRTNALIVQANPRDMLEIEAMIRQLDVQGSDLTAFMRRFQLKNTLATEMQTVLTNALNSGVGTRGTMLSLGTINENGDLVRSSIAFNVGIVADTRSNSLIVTAPADTMPLIAALIEQLDQLPAAESRIRVFTLANGDAFNLTTLLNNLFVTTAAVGAQTIATVRPGFEEGESTLVSVRFQADTRTNSIIAIGSEGDLSIAEALLLRLDAENLNNRTVFTMKLINTPAEEIAPILNNYFTTERQFNTLNIASFLPNSPIEQYRMETSVIAEPISNSLIISTTPRHYEMVRKIVQELDERPLMVAIDVLIAEVGLNRAKDRGVEFGLQDSILFDRAMGTGGAAGIFPNLMFGPPGRPGTAGTTGTGGTADRSVRPSAIGTQGVTSLGVGHAAGGGGFSFSASSQSVSILIRALETNSRTQILSRPRLVTLHNRQAQIEVGSVVPYASGTTMSAQGTTQQNMTERSVGTILDIVPRIMPDGMIAIALYVERSSINEWRTIGGLDMPVLNNTTASTTINAMDGQTIIFAGLITEEKISINRSIPGLNRIPVVRHLFEYDSRESRRSELVIILTPRIIRTPEDLMKLNRQEQERMQWCMSDVVRLTGDYGMRRRSDEWFHNEVRHIYGTPMILHESQLPADNRIPTPMFPVIETR